ncbi:MAG: substrate-binding domain-containing protein [Clostridia bacterium]|nr:substrate-binding domain-containing protein [Clostridia bacterium]
MIVAFVGWLGFGMSGHTVSAWLWLVALLFVWILVQIYLWHVKGKRWLKWSLCGAVIFCAVMIGGNLLHTLYIESIPTVGESDTLLRDYMPYKDGSKIAILDEPSTLNFTGELPQLDGATALYPVYAAFARATYPEALLKNVRPYDDEGCCICTTTAGAYERIVTGEADMIFVASPSTEQAAAAEARGVTLTFTPIGREAFVFFVNAENPIDSLTTDQLRAVYSGEITRWRDLGVRWLGQIRPFQREAGSGSQSTIIRFMGDTPLMAAPEEDVVDGMGGIITRVADYRNHKNAIGYSFRFYSTEMVANEQIKLLSVDGAAPTRENIENGTYPHAGAFYAVTRHDADANTLRLLDWILSPQGQALIEKTGYTPIG